MAKRSQKSGKSGPNEGSGLNSPIDGAGGKSQPAPWALPDSDPNKPLTHGPHPPSPPESPKQRRISLSARLNSLNTNAGPSSTGATGAPTSSSATPSIRDPTAVAVSDLLGTMQNTLKALGNTFDVLGEQTIRVASLGPAVDALSQIELVQAELNQRTKQQDEDMQEVKTRQLETIKEHLRTVLRPRVNDIVASCIQKEIETRVHNQLTEQIPASLRDWLLRYRLQIMQAKRDLHNSYAYLFFEPPCHAV
uniref:RGS domain-containing protein n=1 Tax=Ganoderma boninense TaxID=34458 RepID=A0A5K1K433_9APHY|nr:RGS domain-containing protein [Ganoderma boninense]